MTLMEATVPAWTLLPFVAMLLSIAVLPLIPATAHRWENWRFQLALSLILGVPVIFYMGFAFDWFVVGHTAFEYFQFIALLFALFVVSGGLFLDGDIEATPRNNTLFLTIGAVAASFIGTTGAAMLLIRPLLNINAERERKMHTVIFTILIVANNGGLLTPLGDPPLFLGFLRGVPFTWTFGLIWQWLFINGLLLFIYYCLDVSEHGKEKPENLQLDATEKRPIRILGSLNFVFFLMIIAAVALAPSIDLHAIEEGHAAWHQWIAWRELIFAAAAAGSFFLGDKRVRWELNEFDWGPIREVAVLFIGIFATMMPALRFLAEVAPNLPLNQVTLFIFTGGLSGFLDNAPTYATFFEMAAQLPGEPRVAGVPETYLVAISLGAVTCGALTYIGNGPNFMVKSVAESRGVEMPSFGGYIGWSVRYLLPTLVAVVCIFISDSVVATWVGVGIVVALIIEGIILMRRGASNIGEPTPVPDSPIGRG